MNFFEDHSTCIFQQYRVGCILFSDPTYDKTIGIMVLKATSLEEVKKILTTDIFIREDYRDYELYEWDAHHVLG